MSRDYFQHAQLSHASAPLTHDAGSDDLALNCAKLVAHFVSDLVISQASGEGHANGGMQDLAAMAPHAHYFENFW